jgi:protein-L-isoaspartate(D-aspartate) O-methyltransferase
MYQNLYSSRVRQNVRRRTFHLIGVALMTRNGNGTSLAPANLDFELARRDMVARQIRGRDIRSESVLEAMESVPRHLFVPPEHAAEAYRDTPLPIGEGQTISQPFMVAAMAAALQLRGQERILEVGAGSGYQAAVLSCLARSIIAIEAHHELATTARERLAQLGYGNVRIEEGDGSQGWPSEAPYDAILVTAAAPAVPQPLLDELAEGGRLVLPIGPADHQHLIRFTRRGHQTIKEPLFACRFVPLVGRFGWRPENLESGAQ